MDARDWTQRPSVARIVAGGHFPFRHIAQVLEPFHLEVKCLVPPIDGGAKQDEPIPPFLRHAGSEREVLGLQKAFRSTQHPIGTPFVERGSR
jgi:hypothetical protein